VQNEDLILCPECSGRRSEIPCPMCEDALRITYGSAKAYIKALRVEASSYQMEGGAMQRHATALAALIESAEPLSEDEPMLSTLAERVRNRPRT
jgi:hypothetical protein